MRIVLLGPPGSGKGTQAVTLADELGVPHIATGDLFRAEMSSASELGQLAQSFIAHGNLVPDNVVNEMMRKRLQVRDAAGFVLDGYPRTLPQAVALEAMLNGLMRPIDLAITIEVPDERIVERAVGRIVCPECNAVYHLTSKPPRQMGICDLCRTPLIVRSDDQPSTVRHRLSVYARITQPVLTFYEEHGILQRISGIGTREEVGVRVREALREETGLC